MCSSSRGTAASRSEDAAIAVSMGRDREVGKRSERRSSAAHLTTFPASRWFPMQCAILIPDESLPGSAAARDHLRLGWQSSPIAPAAFAAAADQAGAYPLLQKGRRAEAFAVGFE